MTSDDNNIGSTDDRNSSINLVTDNTEIIDLFSNVSNLLFNDNLCKCWVNAHKTYLTLFKWKSEIFKFISRLGLTAVKFICDSDGIKDM